MKQNEACKYIIILHFYIVTYEHPIKLEVFKFEIKFVIVSMKVED